MKGRIFAAAGLLALAGCGATAASSSSPSTAVTQTCWAIGQGMAYETQSTAPASDEVGCSPVYALGQPVNSSPIAGDTAANATCTVSFPTITWWVWDTDNGASGNAEALCTQLEGEQS